jgi:hypothetical protein
VARRLQLSHPRTAIRHKNKAVRDSLTAFPVLQKKFPVPVRREFDCKLLNPRRDQARAVSVYGMGRFPVTLYKEQWIRLLDVAAEIRAFIAANESQLKARNNPHYSGRCGA